MVGRVYYPRGVRAPILVLMVLLAGCSGSKESPECIVCLDEAPWWRRCAEVEVATGGQPVCDEGGEGALCESISRCCQLAGLEGQAETACRSR